MKSPDYDWLWALIMTIVVSLIVAALAGCAAFSNRLVCSLPGDEAMFVSKYGMFGITSSIAESDIPAECKKR